MYGYINNEIDAYKKVFNMKIFLQIPLYSQLQIFDKRENIDEIDQN